MYIDVSLEICRSEIKSTKKTLKMNYSLLILNICFGILNGSLYYYGKVNWINSAAIGAFIINALWTYLSLLECKLDLNMEKEKLNFLEKFREEKNANGHIEQIEKSAIYYKEAYRQLLEEHLKLKGTAPTEGDCGVQQEFPVQNCT